MNLFDVYRILGCHPAMTDAEVKERHRALSRQFHPDRPEGNIEKFREVQESYRAIRGPEARKLTATRLFGLGEVCDRCSGKGWTKVGKGYVARLKQPCDICGGCGYLPR